MEAFKKGTKVIMKKMILIVLLFTGSALGADNNTSSRELVLKILNSAKMENVGPMSGWTIEEFVNYMDKKVPVNFVIHPDVYKFDSERRVPNPWPATVPSLEPNGDPANGLPPLPQAVPAPWAHIQLLEIKTEFRLPTIRTQQWVLKNLTAKQVLDVAVMSFDKPVKYIVMDYGILIMKNEKPNVATRRMRIDVAPYRLGGFFGGGLGLDPRFNR